MRNGKYEKNAMYRLKLKIYIHICPSFGKNLFVVLKGLKIVICVFSLEKIIERHSNAMQDRSVRSRRNKVSTRYIKQC